MTKAQPEYLSKFSTVNVAAARYGFMRVDVRKFSVVRESCLGQSGVIAFAMTNRVHGAGRTRWNASRSRWRYRDLDPPVSIRRSARIRIVAQAILSPQFE